MPRWVSGFSASVDYWSLDIDKAIGSITAQQTLDQSALRATRTSLRRHHPPRRQHHRDDPPQPFNLVAQKARGVDYEASYRMGVDSLVSSCGRQPGLPLLATNFLENYSSNGINTPTDTAGQQHQQRSAGLALECVGQPSSNDRVLDEPDRPRGISSGTYLNSNVVCVTRLPGVDGRQPHCRQ